MSIKEFLKLSYSSGLPLDEYIKQLPEKKFLYTDELLSEISKVQAAKDDDYLERLLLVMLRDGVDKRYTRVLCALLSEEWHELQEDIVMLLEDIKDPSSIEALYRAALNIPSYDDGRSLAKKSIWALGAIGTPEAKVKLQTLSEHNDSIIKEAATKEIKHRSN